jgi:predicted transcriptional regulator
MSANINQKEIPRAFRVWTKEEEDKLLVLLSNSSMSWEDISKSLNRTAGTCKEKFRKLRQRLGKEGKRDVGSSVEKIGGRKKV